MKHLLRLARSCFVLSAQIKYELWGISSYKWLNYTLTLFIIQFRALKRYLHIVQRNIGILCHVILCQWAKLTKMAWCLFIHPWSSISQTCQDSGYDICQKLVLYPYCISNSPSHLFKFGLHPTLILSHQDSLWLYFFPSAIPSASSPPCVVSFLLLQYKQRQKISVERAVSD